MNYSPIFKILVTSEFQDTCMSLGSFYFRRLTSESESKSPDEKSESSDVSSVRSDSSSLASSSLFSSSLSDSDSEAITLRSL